MGDEVYQSPVRMSPAQMRAKLADEDEEPPLEQQPLQRQQQHGQGQEYTAVHEDNREAVDLHNAGNLSPEVVIKPKVGGAVQVKSGYDA